MKVLLIYPNKGPRGNTPIGLAMASAILKLKNCEVELFDTTFYEQDGITEKEIGEKNLDFKKVDLSIMGVVKEKVNILKKLQEKINVFKPDLIAFSFLSTHLVGEEEYEMCKRGINLLEKVNRYKALTFVGGLHPTFSPEEIILNKVVDIICIGEFEISLGELVDKLENNKDITNIKNLWVKRDGKIYKNPLRELIQDLDTLPFLEFSIFNKKTFYRPYEGEIVRWVDFEISRGCPYACTYCPTPLIRELYPNQKYHREKSIKRILEEAKFIKEKYNINFIKFHDENFLTMAEEKLEELAPLFKREVGIPFVVEVRPESITKRKAELLREMGCVSASIGVECGNEEYRKKWLNRHMTNKQIIEGIGFLKNSGIRTRSFNMIGLPFETRELIFDTIKLNKEANVDSAAVAFFTPFKGTKLRGLCLKEGFIKEEDTLSPTRQDTALSLNTI